MSKFGYIVQGGTGHYDDARSWNAFITKTKEDAESIVFRLNGLLHQLGLHRDSPNTRQLYFTWMDPDSYKAVGYPEEVAEANRKNLKFLLSQVEAIDSKFDFDYTGSNYYYEEVPRGDVIKGT